MPLINGIELAKKLKKNNPLINVIFVTAYNNYALDAYNIHASGYIMKPAKADKVKKELDALRYEVAQELSEDARISTMLVQYS